MALTDINVVANQVKKIWSPLFMKELRESLLLGSLISKDYQGAIGRQGDTVYVSQVNAPNGQLKTVGTDADTFDSEQLSLSRVAIQANKRAVAAFEIAELAELQSQLDDPNAQSEIREALKYAVAKQVNDYLYSQISPSTSSPDHLLNSVTEMNASQLGAIRLLAAQAKWPQDGQWYGMLDPSFYQDVLNNSTLTSRDYVDDLPVIGGQVPKERFGFKLLEDNSRGTDKGLFFHPSFMHLVMQKEPQFKVSDLHSQKKFGYLISVDLIFGAGLGISGANKHIFATAAASGMDAS